MFNPRPTIQVLPVTDEHACYVIDDALLDPDAMVQFAVEQRAQFAEAPHNFYPGLELRMSDAFSARLDDFFRAHIRARLRARRTLYLFSRLSMVTVAPTALKPGQWICHRDRLTPYAHQSIAASVLYLFHDASLGGTSFYAPKQSEEDTARLLQDSVALPADAFADKYALARGYSTSSNAYFERVLSVPAKWNRMIFYDGDLFHSGDIEAPDRLSDDPRTGRLSLNGFFTCTRQAG